MSNSDSDAKNPQSLSIEERQLEGALARLDPMAIRPGVRDRMLLRLGQRGAERRLLLWRGIAALLALGLGADFMFHRSSVSSSGQQWVEKKSAPPVHAAPLTMEKTLPEDSGLTYLALRNHVLVDGVDAIPSVSYASEVNLSQITTPGAWDADQSR